MNYANILGKKIHHSQSPTETDIKIASGIFDSSDTSHVPMHPVLRTRSYLVLIPLTFDTVDRKMQKERLTKMTFSAYIRLTLYVSSNRLISLNVFSCDENLQQYCNGIIEQMTLWLPIAYYIGAINRRSYQQAELSTGGAINRRSGFNRLTITP